MMLILTIWWADNYYIYLSLEMSTDLEQVVVEQLLTKLVTYLLHALHVGYDKHPE